MTTQLQVEQWTAGYGKTTVLHELSFRSAAGEAWAVLGPNGAGKSTLARSILGLVLPVRGTMRVCGYELPGASPRQMAQKVAWVPQVIDEHTAFTGLELVLMGLFPHRSGWAAPGKRDEATALAAMEEVGVAQLAHRALREVSGGERRRVWLARALVQNPTLLVLDEPTAFLDVRHQVETLQIIQNRVRGGLCVVAILHDVNLASHFATHALLLKGGRSIGQGPVADTLSATSLSELYDIPMHEESGALFSPQWRRL